MQRKWIPLTISLALAFGLWGGLPAEPAKAVLETPDILIYPAYIPADGDNTSCTGTPFAVRARFWGEEGDDLSAQIVLDGGACTWNPDNATWVAPNAALEDFPRFTIGSEGSSNAWLYGRAVSDKVLAGLYLRVQANRCDTENDCSAQSVISSRYNITWLEMSSSGDGGWLEETQGSDRAGRAVVVKSGATIIGMYVAEDNSIEEGYSYSSGGYKVSIPACASCGYTIETWELSNPGVAVGQVNTMGQNGCPNAVTAGAVTSLNSCNNPTAISLIALSARSNNLAPLILMAALLMVAGFGWAFSARRRHA